jgi:hypothetical protein
MVQIVPWVFTTGWASGVNGYAVVVMLGCLGRFLGQDGVPAGLRRTDVLIAAAVLWCLDAVADKVPLVDSAWDAVHTAIRPIIGAVVAALLAGQHGTLVQLLAGALGGGLALASHLVKAGVRLGANTSPEPASNILLSVGEDVAVAAVVALLALHPWVSAGLSAALLALGVALLVLLAARIRASGRRLATVWRRHRPPPRTYDDRITGGVR